MPSLFARNRTHALAFVASLALLLGCAGLGWGQPKYEVSGTVINGYGAKPIAGIEVSIALGKDAQEKDAKGKDEKGTDTPEAPVVRVTTGADGTFHYAPKGPGDFTVFIDKPGYIVESGYYDGRSFRNRSRVPVKLTEAKSSLLISFTVTAQTTVSGQVVDGVTGLPVVKMIVGALPFKGYYGHIYPSGDSAVTDAEGRFHIENVREGDYAIKAQPWSTDRRRYVTEFAPKDIDAIDQGYGPEFLPGGTDEEAVTPLHIGGTKPVLLGTLEVHKRKLYHALVNVAPDSCPGAPLSVYLSESGGPVTVPCGPFLMEGLEPGNYAMTLSIWAPPYGVYAIRHFTVTDRAVRLPVRMEVGRTLRGHVVAAPGVGPLPLDKMSVRMYPADAMELLPAIAASVDAEGRFEFPNLAVSHRTWSVSIPGNFGVKEMRYGGKPVGPEFENTGDGELEIEVVNGKDVPKRAEGAVEVVLVDKTGTRLFEPQPPPKSDPYQVSAMTAPGDPMDLRFPQLPWLFAIAAQREASGRPTVTQIINGDVSLSLPPGEYRVFAVPFDVDAQLPRPWRRLWERASTVVVEAGKTKTLDLMLEDPEK